MNGRVVDHGSQLYLILVPEDAYTGVYSKPLRVVSKDDDFLVVKVPGHKYFGGQSRPQNYAPARFEVFENVDRHASREFRQNMWRRVIHFEGRS